MVLFDRWCQIVSQNADRIALREADRAWTFNDLSQALTTLPAAIEPIILQGRTSTFILKLLQGWRDSQVTIPVEDGAPPPDLANLQQRRLPEETCHIKTTSGTTGAPRSILFTAEQLAADCDQIVSTMGLTPDSPNLGVLSLAHSYGFSNLVLPLLLHGIPLHLLANPLPETLRRALNDAPAAVTVPSVPAMWQSWHAADALNTGQIRIAISAGAPLSPQLERRIYDSSKLKIHNFLGASECGGIAYDHSLTPRNSNSKTIGSAMQGVTLSKNDEGALTVSSPACGLTYWPEADASLSDGRFQTSDLVELQNSDVRLLGRADDIINVAGRKVHPAEIENALSTLTAVRHCVVFGIPSRRDGHYEEIVAVVSLQGGCSVRAVRAELATLLPNWKLPRQLLEASDLSPDLRGKISRSKWRKRLFPHL